MSNQDAKAKKVLEAYSIFHTAKGKDVLTDLAKECGLFKPSSSLDPAQLAFREGQRDFLHKLLTLSNMKMGDLHALFVQDYRENTN